MKIDGNAQKETERELKLLAGNFYLYRVFILLLAIASWKIERYFKV